MDGTLVFSFITALIHIGNTGADLPSCERARCHHCRVTFIATMCPETCRPCNEKIPAPSRYQPKFMNNSTNVFQRPQRPQARTVNIQHQFPQQPPQNSPHNVKYNLISQFPTQGSFHSYHYQYFPQQVQPRIQLPTAPPPAPPSQQIALVDTAFPVFPSFPTFTFPTFPPFTFPSITLAPAIYRTPVPEIPPNPFPRQPATHTQLFQPQRQRTDIVASQQAVTPFTVIGSQPHVYLQPQPEHAQPTIYAMQQQAPVYPANGQSQLPAHQLQPQQHTPYFQIQTQKHFHTTNQQPAAPISQILQSHLPQKIKRPALQQSQEYNLDAATNYIEGSYYKVVPKLPSAIPQCPRQPNWEPCIAKEEANDRFKVCCQELGEGCAALCNYDATLTTIQLAVLTGRCPLNKVGNVMICASGYQDATACCEAHHVFESGYEHCRPYCNPAAGLPQGVLLSEQYKCLGKLNQIQRCFYVSQRPQ